MAAVQRSQKSFGAASFRTYYKRWPFQPNFTQYPLTIHKKKCENRNTFCDTIEFIAISLDERTPPRFFFFSHLGQRFSFSCVWYLEKELLRCSAASHFVVLENPLKLMRVRASSPPENVVGVCVCVWTNARTCLNETKWCERAPIGNRKICNMQKGAFNVNEIASSVQCLGMLCVLTCGGGGGSSSYQVLYNVMHVQIEILCV